MPTRPSGVTRICSRSFPESTSPVRNVSEPVVEVTCPSVPSCAVTVSACAFFCRATSASVSDWPATVERLRELRAELLLVVAAHRRAALRDVDRAQAARARAL